MMVMALIILLAVPVVWYTAEKISGPIRRLAGVAGEISRFDFSGSRQPRSFITEVDELSQTMDMMKATIKRFMSLINSLASEQDFDSLFAGLEASKARAEDVFAREVSAHQDRDRLMEEKFREAMKRAEEEPDEGPPIRPWDLD